jgi:carboxylate-amine ligase
MAFDDLERLARRTTDPGFGAACAMIERLMRDGGQARWLRDHLDAGSGMNDLARVAGDMF